MALLLRDEMVGKLQQGKCEVFFKKKNGAVRQMICTLNPTLAPFIQEKRISEAPQQQTNVIAVWDLEKLAWRSFLPETVLVFNERDDS